jgi:hypothetical protein
MKIMKDPPGSKGETPDVAFEAELILEVLHKTKILDFFLCYLLFE